MFDTGHDTHVRQIDGGRRIRIEDNHNDDAWIETDYWVTLE